MWRTLYSLLLCCALPLALLRLLWRSRHDPDYRRRIAERLGIYRQPRSLQSLWIHAVSVGELQAALRLLGTLRQRWPGLPLLVTTTTPAASRLLRRRLGDSVLHVYAPFDIGPLVQRFLDHFNPRLLLLVETELWPNWIAACTARGTPVAVVNARLSARSARRYARVAPLLRGMLQDIALVAARSSEDAARYRELGMPLTRVVVCGDLKFDCAPTDAARVRAASLRQERVGRPMWLAASVHAGEIATVLDALVILRQRQPEARLLLAPRHPERAVGIPALARSRGLTAATWEGGDLPGTLPAVLVIASIGDLARFYAVADFVLIGGTLVARGGHNPVEAAHWGVPLLAGDSWFNHQQISGELGSAGALEVVTDAAALGMAACTLAADPALRAWRGAQALAVARAQPRAAAAVVRQLQRLLPG